MAASRQTALHRLLSNCVTQLVMSKTGLAITIISR